MFCKHCGSEIRDEAIICINCGCATGNSLNHEKDGKKAGLAWLSFFFPVIGLILWLVWRDELPKRARSCGKGALWGLLIAVIVGAVIGVFGAIWLIRLLYDAGFIVLE